PILYDAKEIRGLQHDSERFLVDCRRELSGTRLPVGADWYFDDVELQVGEVGLDGLSVLRVDRAGDHGLVAASGETLGHQQSLDQSGGALVERRVGDIESGQKADVRLKLEDRLERPLRDLGLIRRVRRQPLRPIEHLIGDRRGGMGIEAGPQEERRLPSIRVPSSQRPEHAADLDLRQRGRQIRSLENGGRDRLEELVDGRDSDRGQHLGPIGVGAGKVLHFDFSSLFTYSLYCSAVISLATSSSEESFSLISQPSPYGSSLTIPGSETAPLLTS